MFIKIWKEVDGEKLNETSFVCDSLTSSIIKQNYKQTLTKRGKRRQSSYGKYRTLSISIDSIDKKSFHNIYNILSSQDGDVVILLDNEVRGESGSIGWPTYCGARMGCSAI